MLLSYVRTSFRNSQECWVEGKTLTDLRITQEMYPYMGVVLKWKQTGVRSKSVEIAHYDSVVKTCWSQWDISVRRMTFCKESCGYCR